MLKVLEKNMKNFGRRILNFGKEFTFSSRGEDFELRKGNEGFQK